MQADNDKELADIIREINAYLATRPNAADSFEGILHWWIKRQRVEACARLVHLALQQLVAQGVLCETTAPDGELVYQCNSR